MRFILFNAENLFIFMDFYKGQDLTRMNEENWQKLSSSITPNKPLAKIKALSKMFLKADPDIIMLNEVGGLESLKNLNTYFLNDLYKPYLKEGNSNRGIDVGYLVKKSLPLKAILISHKDRPIHFLYPHENKTPTGGSSHYFSRDVAELRLFKPQSHTPSLVLLITHLKSKLDPQWIDPEGRLRREAELKALVSIYNEVRHELNHQVPVLVAGDFNGIAIRGQHEPEFSPLFEKTDLMDVFEICAKPSEERMSQIQIYAHQKPVKTQIDFIFVSPELKDKIDCTETKTLNFTNENGEELFHPQTLDEKLSLPSDHYPIQLCLKKLF